MKVVKSVRLALLLGAAFSVPAVAQDSSSSSEFETVIVTATKRAEPLQKVPLAVSVISGDVMMTSNLNNLRDIASQVPALNFRTAASNKDQALFLRGLGTISTSPGVEPSTSTVIDGVVYARQGQATLDLLDVDHIEVLRGPQGTLFGKNASAGVLNIQTKTPGYETAGYLDAGWYSEGSEFRLRGGLSGGLIGDELAGSINLSYGLYDGNLTNVWNGSTLNGYRRYGARTKLHYTPSAALDIVFAADFSHSKDTTPQGVVAQTYLHSYPSNTVTNFTAFAAALSPVVAGADNRQINSNYQTYALDNNYGTSLEANMHLGDFTVTSITAYRRWDNTQYQDQDRLPAAISGFPQQHDKGTLNFNQMSEELRLTSPQQGVVDYVVGLFFYRGEDAEMYRRDTTVVSGSAATTYTGIAHYGTTNQNAAIFGEANLHLWDGLTAIIGLRGIYETLDYNFTRTSTSTVPVTGIQTGFSSTGSTDATGYSDRFGLRYEFTPDIMAYVTYSRGFKGQAYNLAFSMLPQDTGVLKAETSNDLEAGLKTGLWGDRITFNLNGFIDKLKNFQVPFYDVYNGSPVTRLINAGRVSSKGVEAEGSVVPIEHLNLSVAVAYTSARIDAFNCPVGTSSSCQVNGKPLAFSPKWKGSLRATYTYPVFQDVSLRVGVDGSWQSSVQYSINQTSDTIQSGYDIWNATVGLLTADDLELNIIVKNIADRHYSSYLQTFGSGLVRFVPRDDSRYVGVNLHKGI